MPRSSDTTNKPPYAAHTPRLFFRAVVAFAFVMAGMVTLSPLAHAAGPGGIIQSAPQSDTTTVASSFPYSTTLNAAGASGAITWLATGGDTSDFSIDPSSGTLSTNNLLPVGAYTISGTTADTTTGTGTWTFTLTVASVDLTQAAPTTDTVPVDSSASYSTTLNMTGNNGLVTYAITGGDTGDFTISPTSGLLSTNGLLSVGAYTVSGTGTDAYGNTGPWSFTLNVTASTIFQALPTSDSVLATSSDSYSTILSTTANNGAVTYALTGGDTADFSLNTATGLLTTNGLLAVGSYVVSGTTIDTSGDTGTWTFTLNVTPHLVQTGSTTDTVAVAASSTYSTTLNATGNSGAVTYALTGGDTTDFSLNSTTGVLSSTGALSAGDHVVSGTLSDTSGDTSTWTFDLTVTPSSITQAAPTSDSTTVNTSSSYATTLHVINNTGAVTYALTGGDTADFSLNTATGLLTTNGLLPSGPYTVSGTTTDTYGDAGTWTFNLTVTPSSITQSSPTSDSTSVSTSPSYSTTLSTTANNGAVTYALTGGDTADFSLNTATGLLSSTSLLAVGSYMVSGTTSDTHGDVGTWIFTLNVTPSSITQVAPTSDSTTVNASSSYATTLHVTNNTGGVAYALTGGDTTDFSLNSTTGVLSTKATLPVGLYMVSGTTTDSYGDLGTWTFNLTVTPSSITQAAPTSDSTTVNASSSYATTLHVINNTGAVTYALTGGDTADFSLNTATGLLTTNGLLPSGPYTVSGTTTDTYGDAGTWTFNLTVTPSSITQSSPTSDSTSVSTSPSYSTTLSTTANNGAVTYALTGGDTADFSLNTATGLLSSTSLLAVGSYMVSGTTSDTHGDVGTWIFTLNVTPSSITQVAPTSDSTTVNTSSSYATTLHVTGNNGPVTYTITSGTTADLSLNPTTAIVSTTGLLAVGSYSLSGTATDSYGDVGTFAFALTVTPSTLLQAAPLSDTVDVASSSSYSTTISTTNANGVVTYALTGGNVADFSLNTATGLLSVRTTLPVGSYMASGTATDAAGDQGTWNFALSVTASSIAQSAPVYASTTVNESPSFSTNLATSDANGSVTWTMASGDTSAFSLAPDGTLSASSLLAAGSYTVLGSMTDSYGSSGTWSFTLNVSSSTITQVAPTTGAVAASVSDSYSTTLHVTGNNGPVTYAITGGIPSDFSINSLTGVLSTATKLPVGSYPVSGTTTDSYKDQGSWSFTLVVAPSVLSQGAPTTGAVAVDSSAAFSASLSVTGNTGPVTYAITGGDTTNLSLNTTTGLLSTTGLLPVGSYSLSGTTSDTSGDAGTWTFTLTVTPSSITQVAPTTDSVPVDSSASYATSLHVTANNGAVTYAMTGGASAAFSLNPSTGLLTTSGLLAAGSYTLFGTTTDAYGDLGSFTFTLVVTPSLLSQAAPLSDSTDVNSSSLYAPTLVATNNNGPVTWLITGGETASFTLDASSGLLVPTGMLAVGAHTVTGTMTDIYGDVGTWAFTLNVTPSTITQVPPLVDSVPVNMSASYSTSLHVARINGAPAYAITGGAATDFSLNPSTGLLTTSGLLAAGSYTVSGTIADSYGDQGTWSFTLTVGPSALVQSSALADSTSVAASSTYTTTITASGATGSVNYLITGGAMSAFSLNPSSGLLSLSATLPVGIFAVTGTMTDTSGDVGTWAFTLTITPSTLLQVAPTSDSTTVAGSTTYSVTLSVTNSNGPVSYAITGGNTGAFSLNPSTGLLSSPSTLAVGIYTVSGSTSDSYGDTGTFTFTLHVLAVAITQTSTPASQASVDASTTFNISLFAAPALSTLTWSAVSGAANFSLNATTGLLTTKGTLPVGTYSVSGVMSDIYGDAGTWAFTLVVTPSLLVQTTPSHFSTTVASSSTFVTTLTTTRNNGTLDYALISPASGFSLNPATGRISSTTSIPSGTLSLQGTVTDTYGDMGTFSFTLSITPSSLTQSFLDTATVSVAASNAYVTALRASASWGTISWYTTGSSAVAFSLNHTTQTLSTSSRLSVGTYLVTGTMADTYGDTGTWKLTLHVTPSPLKQVSPLSVTIPRATSYSTSIKMTGNYGPLTYYFSGSSPVRVSSLGIVTASRTLAIGTYHVAGLVTDGYADTASFSLTIHVRAPLRPSVLIIARTPSTHKRGTSYTFHASSSSKAAVQLSSTSPRVCVVTKFLVQFRAVGRCVLVFSAPAHGLYAAPKTLIKSITVVK